MFRRALEAGRRFIERSLPAYFLDNSVRARPAVCNTVKNTIVPSSNQHVVLNFRNFFSTHWLQNASRVARFNLHTVGNPIQRMVANRRNPLFLACVGFTYIGLNNEVTCSPKEEQLHSWLQNILQTTAKNIPEESVNHNGKKFKDYKINERLGKSSCNSAVYGAEVDNNQFALKMLFNYDADSRSMSLKKAFAKELAVLSGNTDSRKIKDEDTTRYTRLPNHFNVMKILWHFADTTPVLPDAMESYPAALPRRLYGGGYGRNRTMFYVMPKFSTTLQNYVAMHKAELDTKKSLALLAQLLEGLLHLNKHGVAHRDLKSDNILMNESTGPEGLPHLAITDFDCCLAEKLNGLEMPFETNETCKGGNAELMAPEVINAEAGPGKKIDYSKSDEWAAGALAYEIFGQKHPFQKQNVNKKSYQVNDLPELKGAPKAVQFLVKQLLQRHPNDRPDISLAATACQMLLWAPELCDVDYQWNCLLDDVKRWFERMTLTLTLGIWKCRIQQDIPVEKQILLTFLCRTSVEEIVEAIKWMHGS